MFFTDEILKQITDRFADRFEKNPDLPLTKDEINKVLEEDLRVPNRVHQMSTHPRLTKFIDTKCRVKFGALPPLKGASGRLLRRKLDGSFVEGAPAKAGPKKKSGKINSVPIIPEPMLGGLPPPASSALEQVKPKLGRPAGGKRVEWDQEERDRLHEQLLARMALHPEQGITVEVFNKAMHAALPEARWRPIMGIQAMGESYERAGKAMAEIIEKGMLPPPEPVIQTVPVEVTVPVDVEALLQTIPLDRLIGICAQREARARLDFWGHVHHAPHAPPVAPPSPVAPGAEPLPAPVDVKEIEAKMPHILVVGVRGHLVQPMLDQFRYMAAVVTTLDPSVPCDLSLIPASGIVMTDNQNASAAWRDLLVKKVPAERRQFFTDLSRVKDHIRKLALDWQGKHPTLFSAWRLQRVGGHPAPAKVHPASNGQH